MFHRLLLKQCRFYKEHLKPYSEVLTFQQMYQQRALSYRIPESKKGKRRSTEIFLDPATRGRNRNEKAATPKQRIQSHTPT